MAVNPNTTFTAGAILTADQQNRFPRGVMAYASSTTRLDGQAAEVLSPGISVTFTAVANRYYKISYVEGAIAQITSAGVFNLRLRLTNLTGTLLAASYDNLAAASNTTIEISTVQTFSAGSTTVVGTGSTTAGTFNYRREIVSVTLPAAYIVVEDLGPA
jgi:hypothetical protein